MPRYLIERTWDPEAESKEEVAVDIRSAKLAADKFPDIKWEHSHAVMDERGLLKTFCIYDAPNEEIVREHARLLQNHEITQIYEIAGDVHPPKLS